jgi:hypothetical protein
MKKFLYIALIIAGAAFLLSTAFLVDISRAADGGKIAIAYSGTIMGYLEPCG